MSGKLPDWMPEEIEMLTQPLMTEDGFVNEACQRELEAAILRMPETYDRLAGNPEWNTPAWTGDLEIVGLLSRWAIQQAVGLPPKLTDVVGYTAACLRKTGRFKSWGDDIPQHAEMSLCDVNRMLWDILRDCKPFNDWNEKKVMEPLGLQWIDLSALLHNVCISLRNDRRHDAAFWEKFEQEHGQGT